MSAKMEYPPDAGCWAWPAQSKKAHFFREGLSLCRKWMFNGQPLRSQGSPGGPDDCKACVRLLLKGRKP